MVEHKVGELVLVRFDTYGKKMQYLGIIKKVDSGIRNGTYACLVEWIDDGQDNWYASDTIEEMKMELEVYLESQNR